MDDPEGPGPRSPVTVDDLLAPHCIVCAQPQQGAGTRGQSALIFSSPQSSLSWVIRSWPHVEHARCSATASLTLRASSGRQPTSSILVVRTRCR